MVTATGNAATPLNGESTLQYDSDGTRGTMTLSAGKIVIDQQALGTTGTTVFDPRLGSNATVAALTGNLTITLNTTSHWTAGDTGVVRIKQSASTARTVTLTPSSGANVYLNGNTFTMPTTLNAQVILGVYFDGTDFFWTVGSSVGAPTGPSGAQGASGVKGAQGATGTGSQGATGAGYSRWSRNSNTRSNWYSYSRSNRNRQHKVKLDLKVLQEQIIQLKVLQEQIQQ